MRLEEKDPKKLSLNPWQGKKTNSFHSEVSRFGSPWGRKQSSFSLRQSPFFFACALLSEGAVLLQLREAVFPLILVCNLCARSIRRRKRAKSDYTKKIWELGISQLASCCSIGLLSACHSRSMLRWLKWDSCHCAVTTKQMPLSGNFLCNFSPPFFLPLLCSSTPFVFLFVIISFLFPCLPLLGSTPLSITLSPSFPSFSLSLSISPSPSPSPSHFFHVLLRLVWQFSWHLKWERHLRTSSPGHGAVVFVWPRGALLGDRCWQPSDPPVTLTTHCKSAPVPLHIALAPYADDVTADCPEGRSPSCGQRHNSQSAQATGTV